MLLTYQVQRIKLTLHEDGAMHLITWANVPQRVAELIVTTTPSDCWLIGDIVFNHWLSCLGVCDHFVVQKCTVRPIQHEASYTSTVTLLYTSFSLLLQSILNSKSRK